MKWYWVRFNGEKMWATRDDDGSHYPWQIVGSDNIFQDHEIEVLKGPYTEEEIETAYFGYHV
jgi:hypothetical protein